MFETLCWSLKLVLILFQENDIFLGWEKGAYKKWGKSKKKCSDLTLEEMKKQAAVQCLRSASDEVSLRLVSNTREKKGGGVSLKFINNTSWPKKKTKQKLRKIKYSLSYHCYVHIIMFSFVASFCMYWVLRTIVIRECLILYLLPTQHTFHFVIALPFSGWVTFPSNIPVAIWYALGSWMFRLLLTVCYTVWNIFMCAVAMALSFPLDTLLKVW